MSATRSRRGRREKHDETEHVDERWLVSYADMITVLMCLFIVMFAMSSVDQEKYDALRSSLATGFGAEQSETADTAAGVVVPQELIGQEGETTTAVELAQAELERLEHLREQVRAGLAAQGLETTVDYEIDERGLTIRLVGSETFFESNSTTLSQVAGRILAIIGPILAGTVYQITVEGHADQRQATFPFPSNWELSTGRATQVLRHLVEIDGVAAERVAAVGFGSARPIAPGVTPEELALNRRVDIVVLSQEPEVVRGLIPTLS